MRIICLFNLKEGVSVAEYEDWAKTRDIPTVNALGSINGFTVHKATGVFGWTVNFSNDSKKVASGSDDETIRIWDVDTGSHQQSLEGHIDSVTSVMFSPNSKKLISVSADNNVRVWDIDTCACERIIGHSNDAEFMSLSHDLKWGIFAATDGTIRIWNIDADRFDQVLKGHREAICSAVFSSGSNMVASGSYDRTVRIWSIETGECVGLLQGHDDCVNSVTFSF